MAKPKNIILTVIGARPQWMKASALSRILSDERWNIEERILHTGQHNSHEMSGQFFEELKLPMAHHQLTVSSDPGIRMGEMMHGIMTAIEVDRPEAVVLYGDTDSTLAGAWAAARAGVPSVHIEAGLRSFDRNMPEEVNRILVDQLSDLLICPSESAVLQLRKEGIYSNAREGVSVELAGDLMLDSARYFGGEPSPANPHSNTVLITLHRPSNVDEIESVKNWITNISSVLNKQNWNAIFPVHPRTAKALNAAFGSNWEEALGSMSIEVKNPAGYVQMLEWMKEVQQVWTDSGGLQKEAFYMGRPCIVLRDSTEWIELISMGYAKLCPSPGRLESICLALGSAQPLDWNQNLYGDGHAAECIAKSLQRWLNR